MTRHDEPNEIRRLPARALAQHLHALREIEVPRTLLPSVLRAVGLADTYLTLDTAVGPIFVAYNPIGISAVRRVAHAEEFERRFHEEYGRAVYPAEDARLRDELRAMIAGERRPKVDFDLRGLSEFEQAVLRKALEIPRGEVRPYGWIAREIGHERAARAVGTALKHNPIPVLIPCHRVVRGDGSLGQYAMGGPEIKRQLLAFEGANPDELEAFARSGALLTGSDTTHIFCFPACHHARRITPQHRVSFGSVREAIASGYRPCKVCRPATA